jgi:hypothetical protein
MAKENNGRAARRKTARKICISCAALVAMLLLVYVVHPFNRNKRQSSTIHLDPSKITAQDDPDVKRSLIATSDLTKQIEDGSVQIIDIYVDNAQLTASKPGTYRGVYAKFCQLNWHVHKQDPSATPMFRDLVMQSSDCREPRTMELHKAVEIAKSSSSSSAKLLNLTAVVFHESRCGSTLVANMCVAANPNQHRVYSESPPPIVALNVCGESQERCSMETAAAVLRDVMYLMARSNDAHEERVFFKIQSVGTRSLAVFTMAFPTTPWLFVYREPVQVMMSQLRYGPKNANCVRAQRFGARSVDAIAKRHGQKALRLGPEDYCAAHLASITETAVEGLQDPKSMGVAVNYLELPGAFYKGILPDILGRELEPAEIQRIEQTSQQYSKGRAGQAGEFTADSEKKEQMASDKVKQASHTYLTPSYEALERSAEARKQRRKQ